MNTTDQECALLQLIADDREQRCRAILDAARAHAAELLQQAHAQASQRMRSALKQARERAAQAVAAAAAQRQTRTRLTQQRSASEFLERANTMLPAILSARWQQPQARQPWVRYALQQAVLGLPRGGWRVEHAPGLTAADIEELASAAPSDVCEWRMTSELKAGLRVLGNGNCVDASLSGLLADREALAARLLTAWGAR